MYFSAADEQNQIALQQYTWKSHADPKMLVSVIYAIFVLDLKLVKWEKVEETPDAAHVPATS